jgi:hypothetical protein
VTVRQIAAGLSFALALAGGMAGARAAGRAWDEVFKVDGEGAPGTVHLRARYKDPAGGEHAIEVWRRGNLLRRDTDGRVALYVERRADHDDRYRVIDRERHLSYRARRASLFKVGAFPDWASLATLLTRPHGVETVDDGGGAARTPLGVCRWYRAGARRVCWSERWRAPLEVKQRIAGTWRTVLAVDVASADPIEDAVFVPPRDGIVEMDVDRDLAPQD